MLEGIAIIGMAGRFPGAASVSELWRNLCDGCESIRTFTDDELIANGVNQELLKDPTYVRARAVLDDVDLFDAAFFGFTPRDAELTDPQHRLFLEACWQALEDGAVDPATARGNIGVFAGCSMNTYLLANVLASRKSVESFTRGFQVDGYNILVGNDKDYLATRVAYKLNLRGPAITIQTACSTSLVAICQAVAALNSFQCDMALAGGVSISFPQVRGYLYEEGAIASADGHCRAFDAAAQGTVFGSGCGVVLLKRLADAVADGDPIYAVIKGAAVNNDGGGKVSYMAPSPEGQADVIALAHALAGVTADEISYVEAHGTGTPLGDPIEIAGLTQAFQATTDKKQFCWLGAAKTNFGHLESAAGVTGLIKTALALHHRELPATLHFKNPNPQIDFANSPFKVVASRTSWEGVPLPRRAGVSSFGVGGTNAHVVLEEAPERAPAGPSRPVQLLVLSTRSPKSLDASAENLACWLERGPTPEAFADASFTLATGRRVFDHRRVVIASDAAGAATLLRNPDPKRVFNQERRSPQPRVAFLFPGQGSQYVNMGRELYVSEPVFRECIDDCCRMLEPHLDLDLRTLLHPAADLEASASEQLNLTSFTQPALFVIEYALAKLWMAWGIQPSALVGHSIGEFVAAVLAGVMTLNDGLRLVAARARLMQAQPSGAMLSVRLPEADLRSLLDDSLAVAVINSPKNCVASGTHEAIAALQEKLQAAGVASKPLHTSHAFHSPMMQPVLEAFESEVRSIRLAPAAIRAVSTMTGGWIEAKDWADPAYWTAQLRHSVRFADAVEVLALEPDMILLEVGPGQVLSTLAQQHPSRSKDQPVVPSMPPVQKPGETEAMLRALGRLWLAGVAPDWAGFYSNERRNRLALPGYAFEHRRFWVDASACSQEEHIEIRLEGTGEDGDGVEATIFRQLAAMREQLDRLTPKGPAQSQLLD